MEDLAEKHIRRALGVAEGHRTPPWIAVHIRRTGFGNQCSEDIALEDCFVPLDVYARHVEEVKRVLFDRDSVEVANAIVTSDETDSTWWQKVRARGWSYVDYRNERTAKTLGPWHPTLIDALVQAAAVGFVGTEGSEMSLVASRRVLEWGGGVTSSVAWGHRGADAELAWDIQVA
jgi:hypothetical protein